jgi:hypothetical protein
MASGRLYPQEHGADQALWGYESTVDFLELRGPNQYIHILVGTGAPSTNNANAPLGSLYINSTLGTLYVKTAASTWTAQV